MAKQKKPEKKAQQPESLPLPSSGEMTINVIDEQGATLLTVFPIGDCFFASENVRLSFVKFKPRMDKDGCRWLSLTFTVPMSAHLALACDSVIKAAYETIMDMDKLCPRVEIERVYKGFQVEFFATPLSESPSLKLQNVNLGAIALERTPEIAALLHFSTEFPYRKDAGHWAVDNWGTAFWTKFEPANRNLFHSSAAAAGSADARAEGAAAGQNLDPAAALDAAKETHGNPTE